MTTENNVAAQAGDEPMPVADLWMHEDMARDATAAVATMGLRDVRAAYVEAREELALWKRRALEAEAVSPRAPADVERNLRAERVERLVRAAKVYTFNYLQDEHEKAELCTCGPKQHAELVELFAALAIFATTKPGA